MNLPAIYIVLNILIRKKVFVKDVFVKSFDSFDQKKSMNHAESSAALCFFLLASEIFEPKSEWKLVLQNLNWIIFQCVIHYLLMYITLLQ